MDERYERRGRYLFARWRICLILSNLILASNLADICWIQQISERKRGIQDERKKGGAGVRKSYTFIRNLQWPIRAVLNINNGIVKGNQKDGRKKRKKAGLYSVSGKTVSGVSF